MVKVIGAQSVSMIPVRAVMPSLPAFTGPVTIRFQPGGVRKTPCVCSVTVLAPNIETGAWPDGMSRSDMICTLAADSSPFHITQKPAGVKISQAQHTACKLGQPLLYRGRRN